MKKQVLLFAAVCCLLSCDYMLKNQEDRDKEAKAAKKVVIGTDKDDMGCVTSAGYRWSYIKKECIRPIEEGYRLNAIQQLQGESSRQSIFVVFEDEGDKAELYLPNETKSIMLTKASKTGPYKDDHYVLEMQNGYKLKKDGQLVYGGAAPIQQGQVTGDYENEDGVSSPRTTDTLE